MTTSPEDSQNGERNGEARLKVPGYSPPFLLNALRHIDPQTLPEEPKGPPLPSAAAGRNGKRRSRLVTGLVVFVGLGLMALQSYATHQKIRRVESTPGEIGESLISQVPRDEVLTAPQHGKVVVHLKHVMFPVYIDWTVNGETGTTQIPSGDSSLSLPISSDVVLFCRPRHAKGWFQVVQIFRSRMGEPPVHLGNALNKAPLTLQAGDELTLYFAQPSPPWNAVIVPFKGEWIMLTIERPSSLMDSQVWLEGKWDFDEEFPNTAMFWAMKGPQEMARNLAEFFVANRNQPGWWGRFRGRQHTGLVVPGSADAVSRIMQNATAKELQEALEVGFSLLERNISPATGRSLLQEVENARHLIEEAE